LKELPQRKNIRLHGYDYSRSGMYFLTVCVKDKHEMLGRAVVGDGVLDVPFVQLSEYGNIVKKHIVTIGAHCNHITIQKYVIMPNHIHILLSINDDKEKHEALFYSNGTSRTPSPTNAVIPSFVSTLKRFVNKECEFSLFQRSYHDHVIRNEDEYRNICHYISDNPAKWAEDEYFIKR